MKMYSTRFIKGPPKATKLRIRPKMIVRATDVQQDQVRKAPSEWGCEPDTPSHLNQDLAFMYASRRLLEEITRTLKRREIQHLF